jgi:tRNA-splicing ligase RtcB
MWLNEIEDGALEQIRNLTNLPFAFHHIAIMPDSHQGYGMPIGGVMATLKVIVPNAVGVDIGCGMCAVKTTLTEISIDTLKKVLGQIRESIPVGMTHHKVKQEVNLMPSLAESGLQIVHREYEKALYSLGTLGGGNHFIEIQKGNDGHVWIMIHSGSRNIGKQVADHYNKIAKELNAKWHSSVDPRVDLAYLPVDTDEGCAYIKEMNYCVDYALATAGL